MDSFQQQSVTKSIYSRKKLRFLNFTSAFPFSATLLFHSATCWAQILYFLLYFLTLVARYFVDSCIRANTFKKKRIISSTKYNLKNVGNQKYAIQYSVQPNVPVTVYLHTLSRLLIITVK